MQYNVSECHSRHWENELQNNVNAPCEIHIKMSMWAGKEKQQIYLKVHSSVYILLLQEKKTHCIHFHLICSGVRSLATKMHLGKFISWKWFLLGNFVKFNANQNSFSFSIKILSSRYNASYSFPIKFVFLHSKYGVFQMSNTTFFNLSTYIFEILNFDLFLCQWHDFIWKWKNRWLTKYALNWFIVVHRNKISK